MGDILSGRMVGYNMGLAVETNPATNILAHGATLNGEITSMGPFTSVEVWFEYGLVSGGPYTNTSISQIKTSAGVFSAIVAHLQSETTYYFRAAALG